MSESSTTPIEDISQLDDKELLLKIFEIKVRHAKLQKKRRILLEELHRNYLEGEIDPKKRMKPYFDRLKKNANPNIKQQDQQDQQDLED